MAWVIAVALECAHPADVAHRGLDALYVELVFRADGEAVEWSDWSLVLGQVCIEGFCIFDGGVEEDLVEATDLYLGSDIDVVEDNGHLPIDGRVQLGDKMPLLLRQPTSGLMLSAQQCPPHLSL